MNLTAAAYDAVIASITIWREARGEPFTGKLAVAHILRNRAGDPSRWPDAPAPVCLQPWQFSCWNARDPNASKWPDPGSTAWLDSCAAWEASVAMHDPTGGANHYHSFSDTDQYPSWADDLKLTVTIGAFKCYRL